MRTMHDAILIGIGTAQNDNPQLNGTFTLSRWATKEINHLSYPVRYLPSPPEHHPHHLPRPIILDTHLRLDVTCKLLQNYQAGSGRRPWVMSANPEANVSEEWIARRTALETAGAKVIPVALEHGNILPVACGIPNSPLSHVGMLSIPAVLRSLRDQGIQSLMVEGGARVIREFLSTASMVDTMIITVAPQLVGDQGTAYSLSEVSWRSNIRHS